MAEAFGIVRYVQPVHINLPAVTTTDNILTRLIIHTLTLTRFYTSLGLYVSFCPVQGYTLAGSMLWESGRQLTALLTSWAYSSPQTNLQRCPLSPAAHSYSGLPASRRNP